MLQSSSASASLASRQRQHRSALSGKDAASGTGGSSVGLPCHCGPRIVTPRSAPEGRVSPGSHALCLGTTQSRAAAVRARGGWDGPARRGPISRPRRAPPGRAGPPWPQRWLTVLVCVPPPSPSPLADEEGEGAAINRVQIVHWHGAAVWWASALTRHRGGTARRGHGIAHHSIKLSEKGRDQTPIDIMCHRKRQEK